MMMSDSSEFTSSDSPQVRLSLDPLCCASVTFRSIRWSRLPADSFPRAPLAEPDIFRAQICSNSSSRYVRS